jgi:hypothetical protein
MERQSSGVGGRAILVSGVVGFGRIALWRLVGRDFGRPVELDERRGA